MPCLVNKVNFVNIVQLRLMFTYDFITHGASYHQGIYQGMYVLYGIKDNSDLI